LQLNFQQLQLFCAPTEQTLINAHNRLFQHLFVVQSEHEKHQGRPFGRFAFTDQLEFTVKARVRVTPLLSIHSFRPAQFVPTGIREAGNLPSNIFEVNSVGVGSLFALIT
jgi:hypothetical protein